MDEVTVSTKEELKEAQDMGVGKIIVVGSLAKSLYGARKVSQMSKGAVVLAASMMGVGALTSVSTGGLSLGVSAALAGPIAGMSMESILLVVTLGAGIWALYNGYDYEFDASKPKLVLKKRR